MTHTASTAEVNFYEDRVWEHTTVGAPELEAHRVAAIDTAARFRFPVERYADLAPRGIGVGTPVLVTLDDAADEFKATVVELTEERYYCRLTRNHMGVYVQPNRIRKAN